MQILRTIGRYSVAMQDAAISLFDALTLQHNHMATGTLETDEFALCRFDNSNQFLQVPDIAALYLVDYQHLNVVITLIYAIGEDLLQHYDL